MTAAESLYILSTSPQRRCLHLACIGIIPSADYTLDSSSFDIGDLILGVLFLRNTYTVMAYEVPDANGNFVNDTDPDDARSLVIRKSILGLSCWV